MAVFLFPLPARSPLLPLPQKLLSLLCQFDNHVGVIRQTKVSLQQEVIEDIPEPVESHTSARPEKRILLHPVLPDFRRTASVDGIENHLGSVPLAARLHTAQKSSGLFCYVNRFKVRHTVPAVSAVIVPIFPEIPEHISSQAFICKTVEGHFPEPLKISLPHNFPGNIVQLLILPALFNKELICDNILTAVIQDALRRLPIAPGPACLLIVALHVFRHTVVEHIPHIGLVNSHTECIGGNHHWLPVIDEILLILPALLVRQARMIAGGRDSLPLELPADLLHLLSRQAVDNPAVLRMHCHIAFHRAKPVLNLLHRKPEIGPVKTRSRHKRTVQQQQIDHVCLHLIGGRGRKRSYHGPFGQAAHKLRYFQIPRPEILPPLGDTVSLVHCQHGNLSIFRKVQKALRQQPLRCDIDNLILSIPGQL